MKIDLLFDKIIAAAQACANEQDDTEQKSAITKLIAIAEDSTADNDTREFALIELFEIVSAY